MDADNRKILIRKIVNRWQLYLLVALPVIYILVFAYTPMLGIQIAFKRFNPTLGVWGSPWIGFSNFIRFFNSFQFARVLKNTLTLSFYALVAGFPVPIIIALCLNSMLSERYKKFIETTIYIPHFISTVVLVGMIFQVLNPFNGIFATGYRLVIGESAKVPQLMGMPSVFKHVYVLSGIWQGMGWSSIIYMAALAGCDQELHEAAQIDGASRFARIRHIDFPAILPTAVILLILNSGHIMNVGFEKVFLMQNDVNLSASEVISTYVYKVGLAATPTDFSYATAIGLFNSVINFLMLITVNKISRTVTSSSLW